MIKFLLLLAICVVVIVQTDACGEDNDCGENECCIRRFFFKKCEKRIKEGAYCNTQKRIFGSVTCPCAEGLECKKRKCTKPETGTTAGSTSEGEEATETPEPEVEVATEEE